MINSPMLVPMVALLCLKPPSKNFSTLRLITMLASTLTSSKTSLMPLVVSILIPMLIIHLRAGPTKVVPSILVSIPSMADARSPSPVNANLTPLVTATVVKTRNKLLPLFLIKYPNHPHFYPIIPAFSLHLMTLLKPTSKPVTLLPFSKTNLKI